MMKRQIGQIGGVRQQVALLDMLDMSWYNGCPFGGTRGRPVPACCPKISLLRWRSKIAGIYKNCPITIALKNHRVYIKISIYDGHIKSPGMVYAFTID